MGIVMDGDMELAVIQSTHNPYPKRWRTGCSTRETDALWGSNCEVDNEDV
jgi:hypothetical protein